MLSHARAAATACFALQAVQGGGHQHGGRKERQRSSQAFLVRIGGQLSSYAHKPCHDTDDRYGLQGVEGAKPRCGKVVTQVNHQQHACPDPEHIQAHKNRDAERQQLLEGHTTFPICQEDLQAQAKKRRQDQHHVLPRELRGEEGRRQLLPYVSRTKGDKRLNFTIPTKS